MITLRHSLLVPIQETSHSLSYKLPRYVRLYGFPIIWPQASVHIFAGDCTPPLGAAGSGFFP
jgi:hypothetical protein